ncbi:CFEM domain-containing protein, partial [Colletotrichum musicola]
VKEARKRQQLTGASQLGVRAVVLLALIHNAAASMAEQRQYLSKRYKEPNMPYDFDTIKTCTFWYDNYEGFSCKEIRDWRYAISPEDFSRWNPSVTLDCGNWQELSYCVEVRSEMKLATSSSTSTTSTTTEAPEATPEPPALLGWTSLGCYEADRTLKAYSAAVDGGRLTPDLCGTACYADGLKYAGLQAGKECWCNDFKCGGANVINFFMAKLDDALPPGPIPTDEPTTPSMTTASPVATKTSSPAANATLSPQEDSTEKSETSKDQLRHYIEQKPFYIDLCLP